jgi:hypothetical protein
MPYEQLHSLKCQKKRHINHSEKSVSTPQVDFGTNSLTHNVPCEDCGSKTYFSYANAYPTKCDVYKKYPCYSLE